MDNKQITIREIAYQLNKSKHPLQISNKLREAMDEAGIVIVYCTTEFSCVFDGAFRGEHEPHPGRVARIDRDGVLPTYLFDNSVLLTDIEDQLRDYFRRESRSTAINVHWKEVGSRPCWVFETDIPHETFDVYEDETLYFRGIAFYVDDLPERMGWEEMADRLASACSSLFWASMETNQDPTKANASICRARRTIVPIYNAIVKLAKIERGEVKDGQTA